MPGWVQALNTHIGRIAEAEWGVTIAHLPEGDSRSAAQANFDGHGQEVGGYVEILTGALATRGELEEKSGDREKTGLGRENQPVEKGLRLR